MSRSKDAETQVRTLRIPKELNESIKRNYQALGFSNQNELIIKSIREYMDSKSDERSTRNGTFGFIDEKLNKRLEAHLTNTNNEIRGTTWYLTLIFITIIWFAEQFFKLMQIQMFMINDLRFQTSPKSTDEALQDREAFEQQIKTFTAFKKPDVISHQITEAPKIYNPVRDRLSTLHREHAKSAEPKTKPQP